MLMSELHCNSVSVPYFIGVTLLIRIPILIIPLFFLFLFCFVLFQAVLADLSTLKVMPLLQIFLFATVT